MKTHSLTLAAKIHTNKHINLNIDENTLCKAWNLRWNIQVNKMAKNTMAFIFDNEVDLENILKQALWNFGGSFVIITKWPDSIEFWVQAYNTPVKFMTEELAQKIGNEISSYVFVDNGSERLTWR
ncbi:hypothetical protein CDL12_21110 [Handroanthus impetiginosus]|uniref:DUF4283 domain-containing protein n=1 Tax=Handroanthus impetiginosus TaxID=429701 RepID=A0A2G9GM43_9LAMI|nr:hypothetical protein CDL12_21110 [Handroanthus impetiginosus]